MNPINIQRQNPEALATFLNEKVHVATPVSAPNKKPLSAYKDSELRAWAKHEIEVMIAAQLSNRGKIDMEKGAALTETILGYHRGYRDELANMHLDFDAPLEGEGLNRGQKKKVQDIMMSVLKELHLSNRQYEVVLNDQLNLIKALPAHRQEFLHLLDEQIYEEQELMKLIYEEVIRKGKRMINVNHLLKKLAA